MGLTAAVTAAASIWLVLWSLGAKGFDGFMIFLVIVLAAVTVHLVLPGLPGRHDDPRD